jgi:hypothetical protein
MSDNMGCRLVRLVVSCGFVALLSRSAFADEPWHVRGVLAALRSSDPALATQALRALSPRHADAFPDVMKRAPDLLADAEARGALAHALGELRVQPTVSIPLLVEIFTRDGYRADSAACGALEGWRAVRGTSPDDFAARLQPPPDAPVDDWYLCVGLWDAAGVDAALARYVDPRFRMLALLRAVVPAQRAAAAAKVLAALADPVTAKDVAQRLVHGLGYLGHSSKEVLAALSAAADVAQLHNAALSAIARLLPGADPGAVAEDRLLRWSREPGQGGDERLAAFATHSAKLREELIARLVRDIPRCRASSLAALFPEPTSFPAPVLDALRASLVSAQPDERACAAALAFPIAARAPELTPALVAIARSTADAAERHRRWSVLVAAGATRDILPELASYYRDLPWFAEDPVSDALADNPPDEATAAQLAPALLARFTAPEHAHRVDRGGPALFALRQLSTAEALQLVERCYDGKHLAPGDIDALRFWAIALSGGADSVRVAARLLTPNAWPLERMAAQGARAMLKAFVPILRAPPGRNVRLRARALVRTLIDDTRWSPEDGEVLRQLAEQLDANDPDLAVLRGAVARQLAALAPPRAPLARWWRSALAAVGVHFLIWLGLLLTVYPRSRLVQSVMLFNPLGRAVTGLGYTQVLVLLSPWLRRRLFRPLVEGQEREESSFDARSFYDQVKVAPIRAQANRQAPRELDPPVSWRSLAELRGLVVLEGASGLGKTHVQRALLELARAQGRTSVFLRAAECDGGVLKLLEERLALAHSGGFVASLLHRGAIDLFFDGLNEAQPNAIAEIAQFCERARNARIVLSTQPMRWACPPRARRFQLLPLQADEFEAFLLAQWTAVRPTSAVGDREAEELRAYQQRVRAFVAERTNARDLAVLQNRIDLAFAAHLLARQQVPNIYSLRRQVVDDAARAYEEASPGGVFPLAALAAAAIRVLQTGHPVIDDSQLDSSVLGHLAERKLLLHRGGSSWLFRHDTITCYFAAQGFFAPLIRDDGIDPRAVDRAYLDSKRFTGVYLQLAESLPLRAAEHLAEALRAHGRETADRALEIEVQDVLDRRAQERSSGHGSEPTRPSAARA